MEVHALLLTSCMRCWMECSGGRAGCWDHMLPLTRHVPVGPRLAADVPVTKGRRGKGGRGGKRATYHYCEKKREEGREERRRMEGRGVGAWGSAESPPPTLPYMSSFHPPSKRADSPAYETSQLYCADAFRGKESGLLGRPW